LRGKGGGEQGPAQAAPPPSPLFALGGPWSANFIKFCPALDLQLTGDRFCVGKPSAVGQPTRPTQPLIFWAIYMSSRLQLDVRNISLGRRHLVNAYEVKAGIGVIAGNIVWSMPERLDSEVLHKVCYINTLTFTFAFTLRHFLYYSDEV